MFTKLVLAAATALLTTTATAQPGTVFYTSHGISATIIQETPWRKNGFEGYDAVVGICNAYTCQHQLYGIICTDYNMMFGPAVRAMSSPNGGSVLRNTPVQPGGPEPGGIRGYDNDLWHNVCLNDNSY